MVGLKDVCEILEIKNHNDVSKRLDNDEVGRFNLPHPQSKMKTLNMLCINESGLYATILRSDQPEAKKFRKWITSEVLPSIRSSGVYNTDNSNTQQQEFINQQFQNLASQQANTQQLITALTNLFTASTPRPYKPQFTRWMSKMFDKTDVLCKAYNQTRKQVLHNLYLELQDTYDIDLNEYRYEFCFLHNLEDSGLYTMNAIDADPKLKQLFELMLDTHIENYTGETQQEDINQETERRILPFEKTPKSN